MNTHREPTMKPKFLLLTAAAGIAAIANARETIAQPIYQMPDNGQLSAMPMMDMKKCMTDMALGQAKLDALVAKMNGAQGADKADDTSAVVVEMVNQQKLMKRMCSMMMQQMGSMSSSPRTVNVSRKAKEKTSGSHSSHHPN